MIWCIKINSYFLLVLLLRPGNLHPYYCAGMDLCSFDSRCSAGEAFVHSGQELVT